MNNNAFKYIAGACFAAYGVLYFLFAGFNYWTLFFLFGAMLIAVSMFASIPILTAIGSALCCVRDVRSMVFYFKWMLYGSNAISIYLCIECIPGIVMWILLFVSGIRQKSTKKLGIAAGIIAAISFVLSIIGFFILELYFLPNKYLLDLLKVSLIVGALMIGLSAADSIAQKTPVTASGKTKMAKEYSENKIDRLVKLKSLLDGGIITQEEFDAKKKQLLGL